MRQSESFTQRGAGRLWLAALMIAAALAGCAQGPRQTFDLAGAAGGLRVVRAGGPALGVREPVATPPTSSDRIVVRESDGSVAILPDAQWTARLPRLLQDRLVESLQRVGVSASAVSIGARALATDVRRFEIDVARNVAVVEIAVRLIDVNTGAALAAQSFTAEAPAVDHTGATAVFALTQAAGEALSHVAAWARGRV
jgi:cholesterol transport system auxiliary component